MKAIVFALLTTYALGHRLDHRTGVRFVGEFDEYNQSEFDQTQKALKESEKQLGQQMGTPMFTEHAKRIEAQRDVDYMNAREFKNMQREENEENQETIDSINEAKSEMNAKKAADDKRQKEIAAAEKQKQQQLVEQKKKEEWHKAQAEAQMAATQ